MGGIRVVTKIALNRYRLFRIGGRIGKSHPLNGMSNARLKIIVNANCNDNVIILIYFSKLKMYCGLFNLAY